MTKQPPVTHVFLFFFLAFLPQAHAQTIRLISGTKETRISEAPPKNLNDLRLVWRNYYENYAVLPQLLRGYSFSQKFTRPWVPEDTAWIQQTWHQLNGLCYGNLIYSAPVPTPPAQYYTNWASGPTLPPVEPHVGTLVSGWPGYRKIETWTAKWRLEIPSSSDYGY